MIKRVIAGATVAVAATFGLTAAAQATAGAATARPVPPARVINLHRAFEANLGHVKVGKPSGIVYALGKQPKTANRVQRKCYEPNCPLAYNGGPVQHRPHVYLLLWGPNWSTDPKQKATASFMEKFYAGLGVQPQDSWSTITSQYGDGSGFPAFTGPVYEGAFQDTGTPPSGTTGSQFAAEADAFAANKGITDLSDAQIVIATQSGTCPSGFFAPARCRGASGNYCAYHDASNLPFTNLPYLLDARTACGEYFINGSRGVDDGLSIVGGHEYAESITDPHPDSGWVDLNDQYGGEIGDKCAWGGDPWGGDDPAGDVTLVTGSFAMQSLWSNSAGKCVMPIQPGNPIKGDHGKCLDDSGASTANGNKIDIFSCNSSAAQKWTLNSNKTLVVLDKCLADKHYTGTGTKLVLWNCVGNKNEQWRHRSNGEYVLATNGLCLTDPSGSSTNGTQVQIRACKDNQDQRWSEP
jgi:serine protease